MFTEIIVLNRQNFSQDSYCFKAIAYTKRVKEREAIDFDPSDIAFM